jgi:hypothetical protein
MISGKGVEIWLGLRRCLIIFEVVLAVFIFIMFAGEYFLFSGEVTMLEVVTVSALLMGPVFLGFIMGRDIALTTFYEFTEEGFFLHHVIKGNPIEIMVPIKDIKHFLVLNHFSFISKLKMLEIKTVGEDEKYFIKGSRSLYKRNSPDSDFYCLLPLDQAGQVQDFLLNLGVPMTPVEEPIKSFEKERKNKVVNIASKFGLLFFVFLVLGLAEALYIGTVYALAVCVFFAFLFFLFSAFGGLIQGRIVVNANFMGPVVIEGTMAKFIGVTFSLVSMFAFWLFVKMVLFVFKI